MDIGLTSCTLGYSASDIACDECPLIEPPASSVHGSKQHRRREALRGDAPAMAEKPCVVLSIAQQATLAIENGCLV